MVDRGKFFQPGQMLVEHCSSWVDNKLNMSHFFNFHGFKGLGVDFKGLRVNLKGLRVNFMVFSFDFKNLRIDFNGLNSDFEGLKLNF